MSGRQCNSKFISDLDREELISCMMQSLSVLEKSGSLENQSVKETICGFTRGARARGGHVLDCFLTWSSSLLQPCHVKFFMLS